MGKKQITAYAGEELAREVSRRADAKDMSESEYITQVLDQHIHGEAVGEKAREHRVEQRIQELVAEARDEIADATDGLEDLIAKSGVYSIAVWELVKDEYDDPAREHALAVGTERLREDLDALGGDIDAVESGDMTESDSDPSAESKQSDDQEWEF